MDLRAAMAPPVVGHPEHLPVAEVMVLPAALLLVAAAVATVPPAALLLEGMVRQAVVLLPVAATEDLPRAIHHPHLAALLPVMEVLAATGHPVATAIRRRPRRPTPS
jgi:hypothetical protein